MGLIVKDNKKSFDPVPEGMHQAICYRYYDLGTQYLERFGKKTRKVLLSFEIPSERILVKEDTETVNLPRSISKEYSLSLHKKSTLRKDLGSWRGKLFTESELEGFDLENILGVNCVLQIVHVKREDNTYANIANILPLIPEMTKKESENPIGYFSFDEEMKMPSDTPEWVQQKIKDAEEWQAEDSIEDELNPPPVDEGYSPPEDDIPF